MQYFWFIAYNLFVAPLIIIGFTIGSLLNKKIKKGYDARKGQMQMLRNAFSSIDPKRKKILVHCASAGEWEQAVPIMEKLKAKSPNLFIVVTFFSPSGFNFAKNPDFIDFKTYLPLDGYLRMSRFLSIIKPSLIIISAYDVWPNMVFAAKRLGIPSVITAAILSAKSKRNKGLSKFFNRIVYKNLDSIFAISDADKSRFLDIYPSPEKIFVPGDPRFDQVNKKAQRTRLEDQIDIFKEPLKTEELVFIAGSIWPEDEKHLLPPLINAMKKYPNLRTMLVPHELHEQHISSIENSLKKSGLESERYTNFSQHGGTTKRIAIINTVGLLARIYRQTHFAYIGGSFSTGVHNVMEPSVFGQPVFFGPNYKNSFEAIELTKIESGFSTSTSHEMEALFDKFITDATFRTEAGTKALVLIEKNLGASEKIIKILNDKYPHLLG